MIIDGSKKDVGRSLSGGKICLSRTLYWEEMDGVFEGDEVGRRDRGCIEGRRTG